VSASGGKMYLLKYEDPPSMIIIHCGAMILEIFQEELENKTKNIVIVCAR